MEDFSGRLAVITGAATGMGRELARQLAAEGCHLALCDVAEETLAQTRDSCQQAGPEGLVVSAHRCDVSDEAQVLAFRDAVRAQHQTERLGLLFNNAGVGGGGSFVKDDRVEWERTFGVCWYGVYHCTRAFIDMLIASDRACIVNTSSVNGFWACLGPNPHTAYSSAKFAIKGFTESLLVDLRANAPHVEAFLVMPGHVGTDIGLNTRRVHGQAEPASMGADEVALVRRRMRAMGFDDQALSDDQVRTAVQRRLESFRDDAPVTAAQAATAILDGVRAGTWRILVGEDAKTLDRVVRESPETAYEPGFGTDIIAQLGRR